jgi:hypothetical protein
MACRDMCEKQVRTLNAVLTRGQNALKRSAWSTYGLAIFFLLLAAVIGQDSLRSNERGWVIFGDGMSLTLLAGAIFFFVMAKKASADNK